MKNDEAWVTIAESKNELKNAIILARSLLQVKSSRKCILLVNNESLESHSDELGIFDGIIRLPENHDFKLQEIHSKLYLWAIPGYRRCVFLSSNVIVTRNCDEFFDFPELTIPVDENDRVDASMFVFQPSWTKYKDFLKIIKTTPIGAEEGEIFRRIWGDRLNPLGNQYFSQLKETFWTDNEPAIVALTEAERFEIQDPNINSHSDISSFNLKLRKILEFANNPIHIMDKLESNEPIAIIGMSCRLPGAKNVAEFWDILMDQEPKGRSPRKSRSADSEDSSDVLPMHFLSVPIDETDNQLFGISPAEIQFLDPQTRILMEVAWEALEDAGIDPTSLRGSDTAIFTGAYGADFKAFLDRSRPIVDNYFRKYIGSLGGSAARLANVFGTTGPSYGSDLACTSSMVSVHLACQSLRLRETSLALASGVNLLLQPFTSENMGGLCSKDGRCKTFDASADGFARAEGCGVLILKTLTDAVRDGDNIHALIRGTGVVQDGITSSIMTPTVHCEALAMKIAIRNAGILPEQVSYVEAHGTGTAVGDPMEILAISEAYSTPKRSTKLIIGSVKTNFGHTESCSGITGIIKTILAFQNNCIPRHKNLNILNPNIKLENIPAIIPLNHQVWQNDPLVPRMAGINCFGITGSEAHVILQDAPPGGPNLHKSHFQRSAHILSFSAKSQEALDTMLLNCEAFLSSTPSDLLGNVAYSLNTGRAQKFRYRSAVVGKNIQTIRNNISSGNLIQGKLLNTKPKICFLFPGLGCSYDGMGVDFYSECPTFRYHFQKCDNRLRTKWDISLLKFVEKRELTKEDKEQLQISQYSQLFIFLIEYCILKTWESWGIKSDYVLGHSLGELAANVAAGIVNITDAIDMLVQRNELIGTLRNGGMIAINSNKETLQQIMKKCNFSDLDFAAINTDEQTVISGNANRVADLAILLRSEGIKCTILKTTQAYHSRQMKIISKELRSRILKYSFQKPNCRYVSGLKGRILTEDEKICPEYWVQHTENAVEFQNAALAVLNDECGLFLEIAPTPLLSSFVVSNNNTVSKEPITCLPSFRKNTNEMTTMLTSLAQLHVLGFEVDWRGFDELFDRRKVPVPHYPFQRKKFPIPDPASLQMSTNQNWSKYHPLLGNFFEAANDIKIFHGPLDIEAVPYVADHKISDLVIFPAAGFMEMTLASGFLQTAGIFNGLTPSESISVENFVINTPLAIDSSVNLQVILTPDANKFGADIQIFSKQPGEDSDWILHSSGKFKSNLNFQKSKRLDEFKLSDWILSDDASTDGFYKNLNDVGLKFGDSFKSLNKIWKHSDAVLAEIEVPPNFEKYLIHPILTDGMIQTLLINTSPDQIKELMIPIAIRSFTWVSQIRGPILYAYAFKTEEGSDSVALFDSNERLLALMSNVTIAKTSIGSIRNQLDKQRSNQLPTMYNEEWRATKAPLINKANYLEGDSNPKVFIVFSDRSKLSTYFITHLRGNGAIVIEIEREDSKTSEKFGISIKQDSKSDMEAAIMDIRNKHRDIYGIIYLWGLNIEDQDTKSDKNRDQMQISLPLLHLFQLLLSSGWSQVPNLIVITQGLTPIPDSSILNPSSATLQGMMKVLRNEAPKLNCKLIDIEPDGETVEALEQAFQEVWSDDKTFQVAFRNSTRFVPKLVKSNNKLLQDPLQVPNSTNFGIRLPASKSIKDLLLVPIPKTELLNSSEIEVKVRAAGLNFKDVLVVLKPTPEFEEIKDIGLEFAGTVARIGSGVTNLGIGDAVFGCALEGGTFKTNLIIESSNVVPIPKSWTFADAATLPVAFRTAYYCLVVVGCLKAGETILIHTGSGGVGLCAIQLAKYLGANIITTAGSRQKRSHLKNIGIEHVFHSRTLDFGNEILNVTERKGVDMVLNSLTGQGFKEASLSACALNARFVEMSKLDIWQPAEVANKRPDISYSIVDVTRLAAETDQLLVQKIAELTAANIIKPLPHRRFDFLHVRDALEFLQKAKHIGKVVVEMPEISFDNKEKPQISSNLFNDRSTYLITGGFGGIGLEIAKWMAKSGAKYIALVGRNGTNASADAILKSLSDDGKHIICLRGDVGDHSKCFRIIEELKSAERALPPVRGIMHCAGLLASSTIPNATWGKYETVYNPKINGGWNLHDLSQTGLPLQHFVLFSSVVSQLGNQGLSNYAAANSFLDALGRYRNSMGLHTLNINWGQWSQVGLAAEMTIPALTPVDPDKFISALELLLKSQSTEKCVSEMDSSLLMKLNPNLEFYIEEGAVLSRKYATRKSAGVYEIDGAAFEKEYRSSEMKNDTVLKHMSLILKQILMLGETDEIDVDDTFQNLGLDSLMFVQLKNSVEILFGNYKVGISKLVSETQTLGRFSNQALEILNSESKH